MLGLLLFISIGLIIRYFWHSAKKSARRMNKKWTYVFLATYAAILIIATISFELIDTDALNDHPKVESNEVSYVLDAPLQKEDLDSIDAAEILDKRTHPVRDTLRMTAQGNDINSTIIVERKNENDGVIDETIIKPLLVIGGVDFSDQLNYKIPEWTADSVTFLQPPLTEITYSSYREAYLLSQFTHAPGQRNLSYSKLDRQITIHLLVPKDLIIAADDQLHINYITE